MYVLDGVKFGEAFADAHFQRCGCSQCIKPIYIPTDTKPYPCTKTEKKPTGTRVTTRSNKPEQQLTYGVRETPGVGSELERAPLGTGATTPTVLGSLCVIARSCGKKRRAWLGLG